MDGRRHPPRFTGRSRSRAWRTACASSAIFAGLLLVASGCAAQVAPPESPDVAPSAVVAERPNSCGPLPLKWKWERQMHEYGHQRGQVFDPATNPDISANLGSYYYDAAWVFFQIGDYLEEPEPWSTYARWALQVYREAYLVPNNFAASGYWRFPHGLAEDLTRGGSTAPTELDQIRDRPAFSTAGVLLRVDEDGVVSGHKESLSREVAYALQANVIAERAGQTRVEEQGKPRAYWMVEFAAKHLNQWRTQSFLVPDGRFAPFMFGLTAMSLIEFVEWEEANGRNPNDAWPNNHWPDIESALAEFATWMRFDARVQGGDMEGEPMWIAQSYPDGDYAALRYQDRTDNNGTPDPAADLNLLIAPVYAWLYMRTGNAVFRGAADSLFAGAVVNNGAAHSGKHFNQHFRHSTQFLEWRTEGDAEYCRR